MRLALLADAFPPARTSAAVQMQDLAAELARQGHQVTVVIPQPGWWWYWAVEYSGDVSVLRVGAPRTKDIGYIRRTLAELVLPFAMACNMLRSPVRMSGWDGIIWYSPTIFLGPVVSLLRRRSRCPSYLILRDIFPEWAVDMGMLRRGLAYHFFKWVEHYQYRQARVIGVQSAGNVRYIADLRLPNRPSLEVLNNWLAAPVCTFSSAACGRQFTRERTVFVYAGNMGAAQGMDLLFSLLRRLAPRGDIGFLFIGRGSEVPRLRRLIRECRLDNVQLIDEVAPEALPPLFSQCHVGLVMLDPRHRTHNIPGKFVSYVRSGLPVLASINPGNDLERMIADNNLGRSCSDGSADTLHRLAEELASSSELRNTMAANCRAVGERLFSPVAAAGQIVSALQASPNSAQRTAAHHAR